MCYDDGGPGIPPGAFSLPPQCPLTGRAEFDCGADDYFNPAPAAGLLSRDALEPRDLGVHVRAERLLRAGGHAGGGDRRERDDRHDRRRGRPVGGAVELGQRRHHRVSLGHRPGRPGRRSRRDDPHDQRPPRSPRRRPDHAHRARCVRPARRREHDGTGHRPSADGRRTDAGWRRRRSLCEPHRAGLRRRRPGDRRAGLGHHGRRRHRRRRHAAAAPVSPSGTGAAAVRRARRRGAGGVRRPQLHRAPGANAAAEGQHALAPQPVNARLWPRPR